LVQIWTVAVTVVLLGTVLFLLRKSRFGRATRAIAGDPVLARACGTNVEGVVLAVFAVGSALAAVAGALVAMDIDMTPTMGLAPLMLAVVATVIGGVGRLSGIVFGALLLAALQQATGWFLQSQWTEVVAFTVLFAFLCVRPAGLAGWSSHKASV
jgi:branched-subunit amino acid ABC-type transport system permease component